MLYSRPFLSNDIVTDPEINSLLKYIIDVGIFQQAIHKLGNKVLLAPMKGGNLHIEPGEQVLIKSWQGALADKLQSKLKGTYPVIMAVLMPVKVQGIHSWIHFSMVKCATEEFTSNKAQPGNTYPYESIEDLKLVFQMNQKSST
jgi:hypothetical protein